MIEKLVFLLLLALQIKPLMSGKSDSHPPKPHHLPPSHHCSLTGWWKSDSHLTMYITEDVPKGFVITFGGFFFKNDEKKGTGTILGARTRQTSQREEGTFGFTVSFPSGVTAVWVGQCYHSHGHDILQTLMLHRNVANKHEYWLATRVASQTWTRKPSPPSWYNPNTYTSQ